MNSLRSIRVLSRTTTLPAARPVTAATPFLRNPSTSSRLFSILSPRRPAILTPTGTTITATSNASSPSSPHISSFFPVAGALDIVSQASISSHPAFASLQIRCGPRNTFNPSHLVRKRRHGFLSRLRTKNGRKTLLRRRLKGRKRLSH